MQAMHSLEGLPAFLSYFGIGIGLLVAFSFVYSLLTPHHEFALIKANRPAAAMAFGGSLLGFCLPLAAAVTNSISLVDCAIWGAIALVIQLLAFTVVRLVVPKLPERIANDELAAGVFVAAVSIGVGLLNAASMTP